MPQETQIERQVEALGGANPAQESERPKEISITPLRRGLVVKVGCHDYQFAFEELDAALANIHNYLSNPKKVEKEIRNGNYEFLKSEDL